MEAVGNNIVDVNENGVYLDDLHYDLSKDGLLDSSDMKKLQDQFQTEVANVSENKRNQLRDIAREIGLDIYSSWNDSSEKNIQRQTSKVEQVELGKNQYQVEPGETLWKIVSEKYDLIDHKSIAEMINTVVDAQKPGPMATRLGQDTKPDNFPDGIKGDRLWAGDIIYLPPRLEKT